MKNAELLGLASSGGQQMPIFTALGAKCTVLDYSEKQLLSEIEVAKRENYEIKTGGQLQAGFMLTDIYHDINGTGKLCEFNVPTFYATRAIKKLNYTY